jgi:pyruvate formate lyase activating enzyme
MTTLAPDVEAPLEAGSPYELRVDLSKHLPEDQFRAALASGDMGFLHSFTTGSVVDGPGVRLVAWTSLCMFRCKYCHNPDTWTLSYGMPVTVARATEELRKYANGLKAMKGGFTLSGGEPLMQARFAAKLFAAAKDLGIHTAIETNGFYGDKLSDDESERYRSYHSRHEGLHPRAAQAGNSQHRPIHRSSIFAYVLQRSSVRCGCAMSLSPDSQTTTMK